MLETLNHRPLQRPRLARPLARPLMMQRLLLIDDDARLTAMLSDYLGGAGFEVLLAGSLSEGREALAGPAL